jgi:hypothetical protein
MAGRDGWNQDMPRPFGIDKRSYHCERLQISESDGAHVNENGHQLCYHPHQLRSLMQIACAEQHSLDNAENCQAEGPNSRCQPCDG